MKRILIILLTMMFSSLSSMGQRLAADPKKDRHEQNSLISCPDSNHPHMIDLGLPSGTLWQCCNEGASKPEDNGCYYRFGQVPTAPSQDQIEELLNNADYTWTTFHGVSGGLFTGKNGNSIFLPAVGSIIYGVLNNVGAEGIYWSSTTYNAKNAYELDFNLYFARWDNRKGGLPPSDRWLSVRPVR